MTTAGSVPERAAERPGRPPDAILLEAHRGERRVTITLHYAAVQELRAAVGPANNPASGMLFGRRGEDTAEVARCAARSAEEPVGLFRAQPGDNPPVLTSADRTRIEEALPDGGIFLLVWTAATRPWTATLFAVDGRQVSAPPLLEFPLDEYLLRNGWLTGLTPPAPPPHTLRQARPHGRAPWIAIAGTAALLGAGVAVHRYHAPPASAAAAPPSPLELKATRGLDELEISWNRSADAVRWAAAGTLTIRNGPILRMLPVTPELLREGRVQYRPLSGVDAAFRLEVLSFDGKRQAESVQVLGFDTAPAPALPPVTAPQTEPGRPAEPAPLHRALPEMSADMRDEMRLANGEVTVSVLVRIDAAGTVESANVVSSTGEPNRGGSYIRLASLAAARRWKFRPATAAGRPVPSELTLLFRF